MFVAFVRYRCWVRHYAVRAFGGHSYSALLVEQGNDHGLHPDRLLLIWFVRTIASPAALQFNVEAFVDKRLANRRRVNRGRQKPNMMLNFSLVQKIEGPPLAFPTARGKLSRWALSDFQPYKIIVDEGDLFLRFSIQATAEWHEGYQYTRLSPPTTRSMSCTPQTVVA